MACAVFPQSRARSFYGFFASARPSVSGAITAEGQLTVDASNCTDLPTVRTQQLAQRRLALQEAEGALTAGG